MVHRKLSHSLHVNFKMACISTHPERKGLHSNLERCNQLGTQYTNNLRWYLQVWQVPLPPLQSWPLRLRDREVPDADRWCNTCLKVGGFLLHSNHSMVGWTWHWNFTGVTNWWFCKLQVTNSRNYIISETKLEWLIYPDATLHLRLYENNRKKNSFFLVKIVQ